MEDGDARAPCLPGVGNLHAVLQPGKVRLASGEGDDLSVNDEIRTRLPGQGISDLRVVLVEHLAVSREQAHRPSRVEGQAPFAIQPCARKSTQNQKSASS